MWGCDVVAQGEGRGEEGLVDREGGRRRISDKRRMEGRRGGGRRKVREVGRRKKEEWRHIGRKTK